MSLYNKIIWSEGMFLQPQHFQQQSRYVENLILQKPTALGEYGFGFTELVLDTELLSLGKVAIARAKGVLPDGTVFSIPDTDASPVAKTIIEGVANNKLYLGLPLRQAGNTEASHKEDSYYHRYRIETTELPDTMSDDEQSADIQIGKLDLRLLLESDDRSGYTCLPIAHIVESRSNNQVILDDNFLPPCLSIQAAPRLIALVEEVEGLLHGRGDMLASRLTDATHAGTAEIVDFMLLQLINRLEPYFTYLKHKRNLHPEQLYSILVQLLGEITTFTTDKRRPHNVPLYEHLALNECLQPIAKEIRHCLSMVLEQNATAISLEERQYGVWVSQLHDKALLQDCNFILAAYADVPIETIRTQFPNQVKIGPVEQIRNLVSRALPGIELQAVAVAPRQIPYHANFTYFALNRNNPLWQHLESAAGIAFHIGGQYPGLKLELWAIRG